jgi:RimJ/RimL family protein N-acetyltransferase
MTERMAPKVSLRPYTDEDQWLSEVLETDPEAMSELGGPRTKEKVAEVHRKRVDGNKPKPWYFTITVEGEPRGVGEIGIWESELTGSPLHETGWMVLPAFQGRGIATVALGEVIDRARDDAEIERVHAFPGVTNQPSNALCRRAGFELLGEIELPRDDGVLRCNHWALDVS